MLSYTMKYDLPCGSYFFAPFRKKTDRNSKQPGSDFLKRMKKSHTGLKSLHSDGSPHSLEWG